VSASAVSGISTLRACRWRQGIDVVPQAEDSDVGLDDPRS